jgi:CRISPR/Cas system-associated exonuclease Cas4 (RecB family)
MEKTEIRSDNSFKIRVKYYLPGYKEKTAFYVDYMEIFLPEKNEKREIYSIEFNDDKIEALKRKIKVIHDLDDSGQEFIFDNCVLCRKYKIDGNYIKMLGTYNTSKHTL